jgi:hypothetical protein
LKYQEQGKLLAAEIGLRVALKAPHAPPSDVEPPELELAPEPELEPEVEEPEVEPELELDPDEPPLLPVEPPELEVPPLPPVEPPELEVPALPVEPPELEVPPSLLPGPPFDFDDEPHAIPTANKEAKTERDDFMALPSLRRLQESADDEQPDAIP